MKRFLIAWSVLSFHLIFLGIFFFSKPPSLPVYKTKKISVRTHTFHTKTVKDKSFSSSRNSPSKPKTSPLNKAKKPSLPIKKQSPSSEKIASSSKKPNPSSSKKVVSSSPKPLTEKPPPREVSDKILENLEESIAKIEEKSAKLSAKSLSKSEGSVFIFSTGQEDYEQTIIEVLQKELFLPEEGKVSIELTLTRKGTVEMIKCLYSTNMKNKMFLETALKNLSFLPFDQSFKGKDTHTFILHFENLL